MHTLVQLAPAHGALPLPLLAGVLVASVWQGTVLTVCVALALRRLRAVSPVCRTWVWTAVLLLVVLLPGWALLTPHAVTGGSHALHLRQEWSAGLLALWAASSAWRGTELVLNGFRLWRLAGRAVPVATQGALALLLGGSRGRAALCVSAEVDRPSVAGFFRPRVLLPQGLLATLSPAELEHVVRHEMEHLRRWDDWMNLGQQVALVLLPLHPALLWLDRRLSRERELACDDGVLRATHAGKAYAACLVKLAEDSLQRRHVALALSALGARARQSELMVRVRRILAGPDRPSNAGSLRLAVGGLAIAVPLAAGMLARSPEWIRFDGGSPELAQAATATPGKDWGMPGPVALPVLATETSLHSGLARRRSACTLPAIMQQVAARVQRPEGSGARRMSAVARPRATVRVVPVRAAWKMRESSGPVPVDSAMPRMRRIDTPEATSLPGGTARLVVTEFEVSQPMYAAVAVQDGWLIFQL